MLGVAGLGDEAEMAAFVETFAVGDFSHVADVDGAIWLDFGVFVQPSFAFVDDDGSVEIVSGALSPEELDDRLRRLTEN